MTITPMFVFERPILDSLSLLWTNTPVEKLSTMLWGFVFIQPQER